MTRHIPFLLLGAILGTSWLPGANEIIRVWPGYRDAESFESLGELLGKGESAGGRILARTKPEDRNGFYFLTRIRSDAAVTRAEVQLALIIPGSNQAVLHTFPVSLPAGQAVLQLGVTGTDWPAQRVRPIAWRIIVRTASGDVLAQTQSFLWSQP